MSLNDAAADEALDVYVNSLDPPAADPVKTKAAMRALFRAIYSGIVANAVVNIGQGRAPCKVS